VSDFIDENETHLSIKGLKTPVFGKEGSLYSFAGYAQSMKPAKKTIYTNDLTMVFKFV